MSTNAVQLEFTIHDPAAFAEATAALAKRGVEPQALSSPALVIGELIQRGEFLRTAGCTILDWKAI